MKPKDLMYCRIWLLFSGSILSLTFLKSYYYYYYYYYYYIFGVS